MAALNLNIDLLKFSDSSGGEKSTLGILSLIKRRSKVLSSELYIPRGYDPYDYRVFLIVEEFLQPHSKTSVQEAADHAINIFPTGHLGMTAINTVCLECAEQIPYAHPSHIKLARLLWVIGRSGKRVVNSGRKNIPEAIHCFYQQLGEDITDAIMDPGDDDASPERFVNFNSFLAHLMNSGMWVATPEQALRTMRRAFEESRGKDDTEIQAAWVMGAAQWILWSGQVFLESLLCQYNSGNAISDRTGTLEKWNTWKDEFWKVSQDDSHGEECKGVARKAACVMEALEKGMLL